MQRARAKHRQPDHHPPPQITGSPTTTLPLKSQAARPWKERQVETGAPAKRKQRRPSEKHERSKVS